MQRYTLLILLLAVGYCRAMETGKKSREQVVDQLIEDLGWEDSTESEQEEQEEYKPKLSKFAHQLKNHQRLVINKSDEVVDEKVDEERKKSLGTMVATLIPFAKQFIRKTHTGEYIETPLHLAVKHALGACVKRLLIEKANPNGQDYLGKRPLHIAVGLKDPKARQDLIQELYNFNAHIDGADTQGCTPLTTAVFQGKLDTAKFFLEHRANPNINVEAERQFYRLNKYDIYATGMSPLYVAASCSNEDAVSLLLVYRAKLKQTEHVAAQIAHKALTDGTKKALWARVLGISAGESKMSRTKSY